ncbi:hypothetical protein VQ02_33845 [Methylobacterium variabile]|uniref:Uncharacterized protein n=1 Tax=Methylobacterium variabile TaxID=298794 RepID=A0A0J6RVS0_9HYPH|nr:hypothetical protein VQ02_33845 [Methylobacterium variabile]
MDQSLSSDLLPAAEDAFVEAPAPRSFLDRLFDRGLLIRTGVDGLYGRSGAFESVVEALDHALEGAGAAVAPVDPGAAQEAAVVTRPPVRPRRGGFHEGVFGGGQEVGGEALVHHALRRLPLTF